MPAGSCPYGQYWVHGGLVVVWLRELNGKAVGLTTRSVILPAGCPRQCLYRLPPLVPRSYAAFRDAVLNHTLSNLRAAAAHIVPSRSPR